MAFTARLFVLLAITIPILAVINDLPNKFPTGNAQDTDIDAILEQINDSCPPFGHPDKKFRVTVLGTTSPEIGGCASMVPPNHDIISSFNLWLGSVKTGGGRCGEKNMDHYIFDCISKYPFLAEEETLEGWYIMLYDRTARWSGHQDYRCALYQTVNEDPPMIQMVISANQSCEGLSNIQQSEPTVSKGSRHFSDGSVALLFSEDLPQTVVWRKKRSEEEGGGCRFPDWSQGSWTDLKVDENLIRYEPAFHEKDDIDYGNENDDGKDGDTETTGGEQYMKRSQRHAPVGISGIDHPSSHHSRLHRGRRSIPYINTVKMFRKQTSTVQDNTLGKYWIKRQLYNDNMRNFDSFNYRYEEKETNREKRRCYCFTDSETFTPKTDKDQMELFNKAHKYSQTTQKYPEDLNQKSKYPFDTVEFRKKRELSNQDVKEDTMRNYSYRDFKPFIPDDMNIPKILHEKNTFSTKKKTTNLNKKKYSFDIVQQKEKSVKQLLNYNEENINNTKEICFCYDDVEGFLPKNYEIINKLINKMTKFLTMTRKHPGDLKEKSKFPLNFSKIRKKRESNNQNDHGTEGMKHRQKRCLFTETKTSTERYRDAQFENPKTGDPIEPSSKPKTYFGTTENPTARYIIPRSISEDQIIVDDEEEALKKIKNIDQFNRRMRWLNIMRAIESVKNHRMQQSNVDIKHDHGIDGMDGIKHRKKRCLFTETKTSTERYRDVQFENPKTGDPTEPSSKPKTYFGTTENPTARYIRPRSIFEDEVIADDDDEAVKKMKITEQQNRRIRWFNIMRVVESIRNNPMLQPNRNTKDKEYEVIPENTKVPPAVRYLKHAESQGIPYIQALFNWRSMERAYRQRIAEVAYSAYPGQIHPDIVMGDFDQTYDGIEYDFNPWYPEGTMDDPTAYRALTLPGGYKLEPRLSRRPTFEQEHSSDDPESATVFSPIRVADINYSTDQENTSSLNKRMRRSSTQLNQQQHARASFTWRCEMAVDNDVKQLPQPENGAKFLTYGGRVVENNEMSDNDQHNEQESKMSYGCLWLVPRGPNILEFSIIGTGMPLKNQSMQTFAQQLCSGNHGHRKDTSVRNEKKLRLHRPSWVTETRTDDKKRVPVRCPVPPGIVFYGVVPAPPPPSTVSINKDQQAPLRLCAKLVSSADDCTAGQMGPADQMKYTVSECVDQDSSTGTSETMVAQQTIFEEREYQCIGQWTEPQQHISPVAGEKPVMLTYTYLKRLSPVSKEGAQYECFVGTPIPNDEGLNPETTTTILLTEAGTNTKCSRLSDPYRSGMKLVGTKIKKEGACKGYAQPVQDSTGGSWYSLKPQPISPSIPSAENGGGAWYAAPPVPVVAVQGPTTMMPILTGRHTGGNGHTFTSSHNEQNRRPQSANLPPHKNHSFRTVADKRILILAVILFTARRFFN